MHFECQAHNIVRKREILETNAKFEEIINFYLIFFCILVLLQRFLSEELSVTIVLLTRAESVTPVSRYRDRFT